MKTKILLVLFITLNISYVFADTQSYGSIIQRRSKQIQDLKSRILKLENIVDELKLNLKHNSYLSKSLANSSITGLKKVVEEQKLKYILVPKAENIFFKIELPILQEKTDYDLALATLQNDNLNSARRQLIEFIKKYPSSLLQSNATFWYAESFYRKGHFNRAAINYLQSYKKHPKSSKSPDALLKLSYSLASLNKNKEACSMLEKLELEFPQRPISSIKRANEAKKKFYCQ